MKCFSSEQSLIILAAQTECSPIPGWRSCWCSAGFCAGTGVVWSGRCSCDRGGNERAPTPWAGWTSSGPPRARLRPPQTPPSAGAAPAAAGRWSPAPAPESGSPESSTLHFPGPPSGHPPERSVRYYWHGSDIINTVFWIKLTRRSCKLQYSVFIWIYIFSNLTHVNCVNPRETCQPSYQVCHL